MDAPYTAQQSREVRQALAELGVVGAQDPAMDIRPLVLDQLRNYRVHADRYAQMETEVKRWANGDVAVADQAQIDMLSRHLATERARIATIDHWMRTNTNAMTPGVDPVEAMIRLLDTTRATVQALWPIMRNAAQSAMSALRSAGVKLPDSP